MTKPPLYRCKSCGSWYCGPLVCVNQGGITKADEANARLIAAAPDLLEALEYACEENPEGTWVKYEDTTRCIEENGHLRKKLTELCDRLDWRGPSRESNLAITVREARALLRELGESE